MTTPPQNSWAQVQPAPRPVAPPPAEPPKKRGDNRGVYIFLGVCVALIAGVVILWGAVQNAPAKIVTPVRAPAPKKNGFDALKAAAKKLTKQKEVGRAASRITEKDFSPAQKQALVRANDAAITGAVAALSLPYLETNNNFSGSIQFPHYVQFRALTRTLVLAGNVAWDAKKPKIAATRYTDAITIGRRIPHNTVIIGRLVGVACETIGRRPVWERFDTMDEPTATLSLNRLNALQAERLPYAVTLGEEKFTLSHMLDDVYKSVDKPIKPSGSEEDKEALTLRVYAKIVPRVVASQSLNKKVDELIRLSKKPYPQSKIAPTYEDDLFSAALLPVMFKARVKFLANETSDNLLRTALALRVYKLRNGKYPAQLSDLVAAKLLPSVPEDPFALSGEPLKYKTLADGRYVLYSIGTDSVDDGGKGIETKKDGKTVRYIDAESKGDVVAGWYTY